MPVGDRRSRPSEPPHLLGVRAETGVIPTVGVGAAAALRAAVPTGGRRSLACRAISPSGVRAERGVIPPVGAFAVAALRAAVPTGGRRSLACRAISPSGVRAETGVILTVGVFGRGAADRRSAAVPRLFAMRWEFRGAAELCRPHREDCRSERSALQSSSRLFSVCGARHSRWRDGASSGRVSRSRAMRSETGAPAALVLGLWCAALTLAGWSVIGAGFALPRDAGRRPALQPCSRLFSVCGARRSRWQDGASSVLVSRSRAMPVGDRRSSRARACSRSVVRGAHVGGTERHRGGFRAPARCRSETGAPGRPSRLICWGSAPRGEPS